MSGSDPIVITGGAGFIGSNVAASFLDQGRAVVIVDDLSRAGVERNLAWLTERYPGQVRHAAYDLTDSGVLAQAVAEASAVLHLAAQVAVTTSLADPVRDFEVNARGTLNLLEAVRASGRRVPVLYASTNKVYGALDDLCIMELEDGCLPEDSDVRSYGVGETRSLDFHTPYGCSKGVADQYVLDYARSYGMPTAVLRMSCVYGPHQCGTEDQGWVAHFMKCALAGEPVTLYGSGRQVRDVLHVTDAVAAWRGVLANIEQMKGHAFNLGGGPANAVSLMAALTEIGRLTGRAPRLVFDRPRTGDQAWFVADTRKLQQRVGWAPRIGWREGFADLARWLTADGPGSVDPVRRRA